MNGLQFVEIFVLFYFMNGSDYDNSVKYLCMFFWVCVFEFDEEDIKFEFWGLKEVVQLGEFDLDVYLKKLVWRGQSLLDFVVYCQLGKNNCDM